MVKPTEPFTRAHRGRRVTVGVRSTVGAACPSQASRQSRFVVIDNIFANQPAQMGFAQRNGMVEKRAATASDPALRDPVLLRFLNARPRRLQIRALQGRHRIGIESSRGPESRTGIDRLPGTPHAMLEDPGCSGVTSDTALQDPAPIMLDGEETIQLSERHCRHRKEIPRYINSRRFRTNVNQLFPGSPWPCMRFR
jgi:hypothetical protein